MSIVEDAYKQGQQAALEKFAAMPLPRAAAIRGSAYGTAPHAPAPVAGVTAHPVPTAAPAAPADGGFLQKAWGGLNRVASNPLGQMALGIGAPLAIGSLMSGSSNQQPQY